MSIIKRGSTLHLRRRVPNRYRRVEPRETVWISLHTDSQSVAHSKADRAWAQMIEAWEARLAGDTEDAEARHAAAQELARVRGFRYLDIGRVASLPVTELVERVEAIPTRNGQPDPAGRGAAPGPAPSETPATNGPISSARPVPHAPRPPAWSCPSPTQAMNAHLAEIARTVAPGAHAILVLDGAGWHAASGLIVPDTLSLLTLPPYAPELNPIERLGLPPRQQARHHRLRQLRRHRRQVLRGLERLRRRPSAIASITSRSWAEVSN